MRARQWLFKHIVYRAALRATGQSTLYSRKAFLEEQQFWSQQRLVDYRDDRLRQILCVALEQVPYYQGLSLRVTPDELKNASTKDLPALLETFPIISKQTLRKHSHELRAVPRPDRIHSKTTGGSTGEPVTVLKDAEAVAQERAAMWLAYGWFGTEIGDRCMRFWGVPQSNRRKWFARLGDFAMNRRRASSFAFSEEDLARYWKTLGEFSPQYLHGYASMLVQVASFGEQRQLPPPSPHLKSIVATAEVLSDSDKAKLQRVFDAPVQIEYGCGEVGPIAYTCEEDSLHQLVQNIHVEILDSSDQPARSGRLVITDLHNVAMPLVRYDLGDLGSWGVSCSCGRGLPLLQGVHGRAYDIVVAPNGERFHGEFFMYLFEDVEREGGSIDQFQVEQTSRGELTIRMASSDADWERQKRLVMRKFQQRLPMFSLTIHQVERIDRLPSGKMQVVSSFTAAAD